MATTAPPAPTQTFNRREVAHRVFAAEFNASRVEVKEGTDEKSPSYVVTPLGAKINRLLVVGVLTEVESVGESGDVQRARVSDPTGLFTVYAGRYQPEVSAALATMQPPQYVAVVGKARTYEPEPGRVFTSIRPESITVVEESVRDHWILETARLTRARVDAMHNLTTLTQPTPDALAKLGVPDHLIGGTMLAAEKYEGDVDLDYFKRLLPDAVSTLTSGETFRPPTPPMEQPVAAVATRAAPAPKAAVRGPGVEVEGKVLGIIKELAASDEKGAQWDAIVKRGETQSVSEDQVEEALNSLMDKGQIYEPILGRLKLA